ncbi:MAG: MliC family protein [bacterium]
MLKNKRYYMITVIILVFFINASLILPVRAEKENLSEEGYRTFLIKDVYFSVEFDEETDTAELIMPNGSREVLQHQISASGAKYGNQKITFWNKGDFARVFLSDEFVFWTEMIEADSENLSTNVPEADSDERVIFRNIGFYVMLQELDEGARVILDGEELIRDEQGNYSSYYRDSIDNINIEERDKDLIIKIGDYEFRAQPVAMEDYLDDKELILRGVGQEPGWLIKIREEEIELELDYAQVKLSINPSYYTTKEEEGKIIYEVTTSLVNFQIKITEKEHSDVMSGSIFPYTVEITAGERKLTGGVYIGSKM